MKRFFDVLIALVFFPILILSYIILAPIIKLSSKGPIIFRQKRTGRKKKKFMLYKFRSIYSDRVTFIGRIIRKTKIDELPQIINILKGDMSIVGPRPLTRLYEQEKVYSVRPGLIYFSYIYRDFSDNINYGRNIERGTYELEYVERVSLFFDIKIIFKVIVLYAKRMKKCKTNEKILLN